MSEDPRARHLPPIRPAAGSESQPGAPSSQKGFCSRQRNRNRRPLESKRRRTLTPPKAAVRRGRARRPGEADPSPALTIAARRAAAASRAARGSRPPPSSNPAAARRRRGASPLGLGRAQQWTARPRPASPRQGYGGCGCGCGAAGRGARPEGAECGRQGPGRRGEARRLRLPAAGAALAGRSPPGNPTGSLPDWPGRSGPDLHVNGREGSLRFENGFQAGGVGLRSGPRGIKGTDAHTPSVSFTSPQPQR